MVVELDTTRQNMKMRPTGGESEQLLFADYYIIWSKGQLNNMLLLE
jgi:hypothetical protein